MNTHCLPIGRGALLLLLLLLLLSSCTSEGATPSTPAPATSSLPTLPAAPTSRPSAAPDASVALSCQGLPLPPDLSPAQQPPYSPGPGESAAVQAAVARFHDLGLEVGPAPSSYDPTGEFMGFGLNDRYEDDPSLRWDAAGIPLVEYSGSYYRNPVTVAQYALTLHGRYVRGLAGPDQFLQVVAELMSMQDERGAFPAPYPFVHYRTGETLQPGWVSGLAVGQALSVLSRAYSVDPDPAYLLAGDAALRYIMTPASAGGPLHTLTRLDPSLGDLVSIEEFMTARPDYTLNGFMLALVGIYDWATLVRPTYRALTLPADELFDCGLATLVYLLPYYDVGGFSAYDLGHVVTGGDANLQAEYHLIHLELLGILDAIRPLPELQRWRTTWAESVGDTP